jgi:hypothetical protein
MAISRWLVETDRQVLCEGYAMVIHAPKEQVPLGQQK